MKTMLEMCSRAAAITAALCLASCGFYQSTESTDDLPEVASAPVYVTSTTPQNPGDDQQPVRKPTPCLNAREPASFPIVQLDRNTDSKEELDEPSVTLVIFDRSGSMSGTWGHEDPSELATKWDAAGEALLEAVDPVKHRVTLGAIFFPQPDDCLVAPITDGRQVPFHPGLEFITTWEEVAPLNPPDGGTPLGSAFMVAEQAIEAACVDGLLDDRRPLVMLLTDGEPNCGTDMDVVEAMAADWLKRGIPTYVFGLPGSESAVNVLERIATAGGTHTGTQTVIVPDSPSELEDDIAAII